MIGDEDELELVEEDELDQVSVDVPVIDKSKPVKDRFDKAIEVTAKVLKHFEGIKKHDHNFQVNKWGKEKCIRCGEPKISEKQKAFIYSLWSASHSGVVTDEAQAFIVGLSLVEASALIERLKGR